MPSKKLSYSTETREKEDKPKEEEAKEPVAEEKPKPRSSQPKEPSSSFMSNIFAALDIYKNKMLVRDHTLLRNLQYHIFPSFHLIAVVSYKAVISLFVFFTELLGS